jgi:hypothetical protein
MYEDNPRHSEFICLLDGNEVWEATRGAKLRLCTHDENMYREFLCEINKKKAKVERRLNSHRDATDETKKMLKKKCSNYEKHINNLEEVLILLLEFRGMVMDETVWDWDWKTGLQAQVELWNRIKPLGRRLVSEFKPISLWEALLLLPGMAIAALFASPE